MKIIHITDSHATTKSPVSRIDDYHTSFLKKMQELRQIIKQDNIKMIIHTGDLFHSPRVSDKFTGQVAEIIKGYKIPFIVIPGNHDIDGYNINTIDQTKLGLLGKAKVLYILSRSNPLSLTIDNKYRIAISGQEYYEDIDSGNPNDYIMQQSLDDIDFKILGIHSYLTPHTLNPNIKYTMCDSIKTDADIILTGHFHEKFKYESDSYSIYNPGSMMRVEMTQYNKTHVPNYGLLEVELKDNKVEYSYTFKEFKTALPSVEVFDYSKKEQQQYKEITLDNFKRSIKAPIEDSLATDIDKLIGTICTNNNISKQLEDRVIEIYKDALRETTDDNKTVNGYIQSTNIKRIKTVEIKNFQSHSNTVLDFSNGLNIITGESNHGKSSIIRAILWVIDNQPLGSGFITTGKDKCSVKIVFDDGSYIERIRTRTSTGTYKIGYYADNGFKEESYAGFANSIPIEISNIHQMPKVNITKDIETHLNVLGQLDKPFLITDSSMEKAKAIGRILGTHVIDIAISSCNKKIYAYNVSMKDNQDKIDIWTKELDDIPNPELVNNISTKYREIVEYIKAKQSIIIKAQELTNKIEEYNKLIAYNDEILKYKPYILSLKALIAKADTLNNLVLNISTLYNKQQAIGDALNKIDTDINNYKLLSSVSNKVDSLLELLNRTQVLMQYKAKIKDVENKYVIENDKKYKYKVVSASTNMIYNYMNSLYSKLTSLKEYQDSITMYDKKLDKDNQILIDNKNKIKEYNEQIDNINKEMVEFIKANNKCPYCGQEIKDDVSVNNIIQHQHI